MKINGIDYNARPGDEPSLRIKDAGNTRRFRCAAGNQACSGGSHCAGSAVTGCVFPRKHLRRPANGSAGRSLPPGAG